MEPERARRFSFAAKEGSTPLRIARSEGVWLYTDEGKQILDASGGAIVVSIGHGRREVAEAYAREAERAAYLIPPFATESRVRLVERLVDTWLPRGLTRVAFTSGGSESVDAALRIVRAHFVSKGEPEALEGDRPRSLVPRHDARDARRRRPHQAPRRLRAVARRPAQGAGVLLLPLSARAHVPELPRRVRGRDRGGDPARGTGDRRGRDRASRSAARPPARSFRPTTTGRGSRRSASATACS